MDRLARHRQHNPSEPVGHAHPPFLDPPCSLPSLRRGETNSAATYFASQVTFQRVE